MSMGKTHGSRALGMGQRMARRGMNRAASQGGAFYGTMMNDGFKAAFSTVQAPMVNGAIKGAMMGSAAGASMSVINDARGGNLNGGSFGRALGGGFRGGLMGGAGGAAFGVGRHFMGASPAASARLARLRGHNANVNALTNDLNARVQQRMAAMDTVDLLRGVGSSPSVMSGGNMMGGMNMMGRRAPSGMGRARGRMRRFMNRYGEVPRLPMG
jgi:hypothetical protein